MRLRPTVAALIVMLVALACSSAEATPTPAPTATSAPEPTPTPLPPFSETRPADLPAWVPDELWNLPVTDPQFPPVGSVDGFTGWDGEGIFRLPEDIMPGSVAAENFPTCAVPTSAFKDYLVQKGEHDTAYTLSDRHWIDFVSPTGYEYYECLIDVSGEVTAERWSQPPGEEVARLEVLRTEVLIADLPDSPVRSHGQMPDGPCQFSLPWDGFESEFIKGGGVLLPSGIIKVNCLYKSVPIVHATGLPPVDEWSPEAFELAGLGERRFPPHVLRSDASQLDTSDLLSAWTGHLQQVVLADNVLGLPIVALCLNSNGVWLGDQEPWDEVPRGTSIGWNLEWPGQSPGHPPAVYEIPNAALLILSDPVRGGREFLTMSAGTTGDEGLEFIVTELPDPAVCGQ